MGVLKIPGRDMTNRYHVAIAVGVSQVVYRYDGEVLGYRRGCCPDAYDGRNRQGKSQVSHGYKPAFQVN